MPSLFNQNFESERKEPLPPPPPRTHMSSPINASLQPFDAGSECLDDIAYVLDLVEFAFQLVDLPDDVAETGDFGVGLRDGGGGARGLERDGALGLGC